jgi:hypothetical protein
MGIGAKWASSWVLEPIGLAVERAKPQICGTVLDIATNYGSRISCDRTNHIDRSIKRRGRERVGASEHDQLPDQLAGLMRTPVTRS